MDLYPALAAYFDADRRRDREALTNAFTPVATVRDEGHTHVGAEGIGDWWAEATARYQASTEPLDSTERDGTHVVRARVSGDFPGSPAVLSFAFRTAEGWISALEIGA